MQVNLKGIHRRIYGAILQWKRKRKTELITGYDYEMDLAEFIEKELIKSDKIKWCESCDGFTVTVPDTVCLRNDKGRCGICGEMRK